MRTPIFILLFALCGVLALAAGPPEGAVNISAWSQVEHEEIKRMFSDENNDGFTDYVLYYTSKGEKVAEELDFNHDGIMDDFYFYKNGVLKLRQIDSNFDDKIDIWVYVSEGVYIRKYEKDTDFDGEIDYIKDYENEL